MLAIIDNYDSFTYNIVQYVRELGAVTDVVRNDQVNIGQIERMSPKALLLSPGPGNPDSAGITLDAIEAFSQKLPIFGVCLGHQSICQHFGGQIVQAHQIMHGKLSEVYHNDTGVFNGLPNPFTVTRYHSLVIKPQSMPADLAVTAWTQNADGEMEDIMGVRHVSLPIEGVQFHPESISTEHGHDMLAAFLKQAGVIA